MVPSSLELTPSGAGATRSFTVKSNGDEPVAVQVVVVKRQMAIDGTETYGEEDEDFLVYPPQMIVSPGQQQMVRVTWLGNDSPEKELSYRAIFEQLPINLTTISSGNDSGIEAIVSVTLTYKATIYVIPNGASADVVLIGAESQKDDLGNDLLVLNFLNRGTAHKLLTGLVVNLTSEGKTITLNKDEQLKGVSGENILAGNKRRFVLPWPKELPVGPVTATFTTN
ncbi:hypothetical protein BWK47_16035 [Synechocystis sp. CACIAM 05]|nr:hypothetical protein BWK47_16035 [Synechocystis sp. CACIAM 05]